MSVHAAELGGIVRIVDGPLPGVTVSTIATAEPKTVVTDATGAYTFSGLPPGPVQVEFRLPGLRPLRRTICLDGERPTRYDPAPEFDVIDATTPANLPPRRQKCATLRGTVFDPFGTPVEGAAILELVNGRFVRGVASKADGSFAIRRIPVRASIWILAPGFATERLQIHSAGRRTVSVYLLRECGDSQ